MPKRSGTRLRAATVAAFVPKGKATRDNPLFTDEQVLGLRQFWRKRRATCRISDLATALGVHETTLTRTLHGPSYPHVPETLERIKTNPTRRSFSIPQVRAMRREYDPPRVTVIQLAKTYGVSATAMSKILTGRLYGDVPGAVATIEPISVERATAFIVAQNISRRTLTPEAALFIRLAYRPGVVTAQTLARAYGVHIDTIFHIVNGESYQDVPGPIHAGTKAEKDRLRRKLSEAEVIEARRLFRQGGRTIKEMAARCGLGFDPTRNMLYGRTYKEIPGAIETWPVPREPPIPDEVVAQSRRDFRAGRVTIAELGSRLKRAKATISDMLRGRTYTHLPGAVRMPRSKMREIRQRYCAEREAERERMIAAGIPLRPLIKIRSVKFDDLVNQS